MKKHLILSAAAVLSALAMSLTTPACVRATDNNTGGENEGAIEENENVHSHEGEAEQPEIIVPPAEQPKPERAEYLLANAQNVNLRSGAGTGYKALGTAEYNTLYALNGVTGGWYKTYYKNASAYISKQYCSTVYLEKSGDARVEDVISQGCKCLGVKYVYGATRYHDGTGRKLSGFTASAFDCSSLMQYIFKIGAGINLQSNTRTQIYQGKAVPSGEIKRGDLLFFTNASRQNNTGIERVGHVALYLGDNYILHTASDYAKIEQITAQRWAYFIEARRMF